MDPLESMFLLGLVVALLLGNSASRQHVMYRDKDAKPEMKPAVGNDLRELSSLSKPIDPELAGVIRRAHEPP